MGGQDAAQVNTQKPVASGATQQDSPSGQFEFPHVICPRTTLLHRPASQAATICCPGCGYFPFSSTAIPTQPHWVNAASRVARHVLSSVSNRAFSLIAIPTISVWQQLTMCGSRTQSVSCVQALSSTGKSYSGQPCPPGHDRFDWFS